MICSYCGPQEADGASYCANCGARLSVDSAPEMPKTDKSAAVAPTPASMRTASQGPSSSGAIAGMPSTTTAIILIVVGFLCGILWGIIGITQYGSMKKAIEAGDAETANKKFNIIKIATIVGVVLNVLIIGGQMVAG